VVRREWILKRNCSIAPRQLVQVFAGLCAISLTVALLFTLRGAWFILVFSVLELTAVGWALLIYARHATDLEYVAFDDKYLRVELVHAGKTQCFKMHLDQMQIDLPGKRRALIGLRSAGTQVEVGRFLTEWRRREFAQELRHELAIAVGVG